MRRLLAIGLAAAAVSVAAPANAAPVCHGVTRAGVCVTVIECSRICGVHLVVDPYCNQGHPAIGGCSTIDSIYIDPRN